MRQYYSRFRKSIFQPSYDYLHNPNVWLLYRFRKWKPVWNQFINFKSSFKPVLKFRIQRITSSVFCLILSYLNDLSVFLRPWVINCEILKTKNYGEWLENLILRKKVWVDFFHILKLVTNWIKVFSINWFPNRFKISSNNLFSNHNHMFNS